MPIIQVNMLEGRSQETKERFMRELTDLTAEILDVKTSSVRIIINEMKPEHFAIDGESVAKRRGHTNP